VIHNVRGRERGRERERERERENESARAREREREREEARERERKEREKERERTSGHNEARVGRTDDGWQRKTVLSPVTGENTHGANGGGRTNEGALKEKSRRNTANGGTDGMTRQE